jgi:rubrerythrin
VSLEEAIRTAIEYEMKVRDVYVDAAERSAGTPGNQLFRVMADEEQYHVDYLVERLREWKETGKVNPAEVKTAIPSRETIAAGLSSIEGSLAGESSGAEMDFLRKALEVERETSGFYKKVVGELGDEGREMFARFLEIETGHLALVQAQIDVLSGTGFWFDVQEFTLE